MDKAGFLKELNKHLAILNEDEQKDILDEYTQHIDMKMEKGMSEAEAIGDFGDIGDLAAEILEAYHVNPQYGSKKRLKLVQKEDIPVQELKETGVHIWKSILGAVKKLCAAIGTGIKKLCGFLAMPLIAVRDAWKHRKKAVSGLEHDDSYKLRIQKNITASKLIGKAGHEMSQFMRVILFCIVTCIRWFWNGCMFFAALITGGCTLFGIFYLGAMVVLLLQGYPLLGVTIACLGLVMCGGAVTFFAVGLIQRRKVENRQKQETEIAVQEVLEHA